MGKESAELQKLSLKGQKNFQVKLTDSIALDFVRIPAGSFLMGDSEQGDENELPVSASFKKKSEC